MDESEPTMVTVSFPAPPDFPEQETATHALVNLWLCVELSCEAELRLLLHQFAELEHGRFVTIVRALNLGLAALEMSERHGVPADAVVRNCLSSVAEAGRIVESPN